MYVVELLPLTKGIRTESLSYFSSEYISSGTLVEAPMQSRTITGIVAQCSDAKDMKATLKEAPYEMKKISKAGKQIFFAQYIVACRSFAHFSGITSGAAIKALTPAPIIENNEDLPELSSDIYLPDIKAPQPKIIQADTKKQQGYINSLVQARIADNESVFICVPTTHKAGRLEEMLDTQTTIIRFDSSLTKNVLLSRWRETVTTGKAVVIIGTAPYMSVPRSDLGLIIIWDEINSSYKMIERPYLDKRLFARHLAKEYKRDCVLSGNILSTETIWEYRNDKISSAFKPVFRYEEGPDGELIDMKSLSEVKAGGVKLFSPPVAKEIRKVVSQNQKMLLFVARRGHRPFTVCNDCGETITCQQCGYPMVLVETENKKRKYICRTCNIEETSSRRCQNCNSWRLEALGVGIDFVAEILKNNLPELDIYQVDSSKTATEKKIEKELDQFSNAKNGVLLTTQLGINRLQDKVDSSAVITADSLLALPDLSISEKLFYLLLSIRELTNKKFFIQTRSKHRDIFTQALAGDVTSFYRDQIAERERFNYPPFSYLIKLTSRGKKDNVRKDMIKVKKLFPEKDIKMYPGSGSKKYTAHALIQIDRQKWVDEEILAKLQSLPLSISINAHPQSLL